MILEPSVLPWLAMAGGLGAAARYILDTWVQARAGKDFPWGTTAVNLSGAFLAGIVAGWVGSGGESDLAAILSVGFLGAFTTFSTWMVEAVTLLEKGEVVKAGLHLGGGLAMGVLLAGVGIWAGAGLGG
jgi:fluoride exporter